VLTRSPAEQTPVPGVVEFTNADPRAIVDDLAARGYATAVLGGGGGINRLFLAHDLVDEIWLTVERVIVGTGVALVGGEEVVRGAQLIRQEPLGPGGVHLRYSLR
jgi:riboflavin biosynthesis pyrimidine reductase